MSQWEWFGGVAYEIGGFGIPIPIDEQDKRREHLSKEEQQGWVEEYIYDYLRHLDFLKSHNGYDVYEEYEKMAKIRGDLEVKRIQNKNRIHNRFEILDL